MFLTRKWKRKIRALEDRFHRLRDNMDMCHDSDLSLARRLTKLELAVKRLPRPAVYDSGSGEDTVGG